jgi:maltooligosyltrehalose trehalohydrolase
MYKALAEGGWGLDGVWNDDFHHQVRRFLTGDHEAYYRDFTGSIPDLARTIRQGWFYTGQHSHHGNKIRGTDPSGLKPSTFVVYVQNHDQIGNRALGERLHHVIDAATYRAVSALLLTCPLTPMLYMGQEWAARSPFQFFTDHHQRLGKMVTEGRRQEFKQFAAFSDPKARERIPDPQAVSTFQASRLDWAEREQEAHAAMLRLYRTLLNLRRTDPALRYQERDGFEVAALGDATLAMLRWAPQGGMLLILIHLRGTGRLDLAQTPFSRSLQGRRWEVVLTSEDASFATDANPPQVELAGPAPIVQFPRPAAVILREIASAHPH